MRKITILLGLLALPFINVQAQTCPDGQVNAKISISCGVRFGGGRDGGQYWILRDKKGDTVAHGGQIKNVAGDNYSYEIDSAVAYYDDLKEYTHNLCLYPDSTYTFFAFDYHGNPWNTDARYQVEINGKIVANNNGKAPDNGEIEESGWFTLHPFTATPEAEESFTVQSFNKKDIAVQQLINPISNCSFTSAETITAIIKNNGLTTQQNIEVGFLVDGVFIGKDSIKTAIPACSQINHTFTSKGDLSAKGVHNIKVYAKIIGDEDVANDTLTAVVENLLLTEAKQSNDEYCRISSENLTVKSKIAFCGLPEMLSDTFGIKEVHIDTLFDEVTFMGKYKMQLISPENDTIMLSEGHGEDYDAFEDMGGLGYANVSFNYKSTNKLSTYTYDRLEYCKDATFAPDERLGFAIVNNKVNPNGIWTLYVSPISSNIKSLRGFLKGWSLEFGKIEKATTSSSNNIFEQAFEVFPNPANNQLNIRISNMAIGSEYSIINNQGQVVANGKLTALQTAIDVKDLNSGIYFLNLKNDKAIKTTKFSKL